MFARLPRSSPHPCLPMGRRVSGYGVWMLDTTNIDNDNGSLQPGV